MKIGFIGLGIMGSRMATNLQKAGHDLIVHNRTKSKADDLLANGATWADSPASVAQEVDVLFTMLAHPNAVEDVMLDDNGALAHLDEGSLWVDCSTVNPSFSKRMAQVATNHHIRFIDAPVAGSLTQAQNAELIFIVGANANDLEDVRPLMEVMGSGINHVGGHGMGASFKMVVNMLLGTSMAAFSEAIALGQSLGIAEEKLLTLSGSAVVPPYMQGKRTKIDSNTYDADFPLQWMHKDLNLFTTTAYETGVSSMMASIARELFSQAIQAGYGEKDFSAIYAHMNKQ